MIVARQALVFLVAGSLGYAGAAYSQTVSAGDPPGRVGRLAFLEGTVSFHDSDRTDWVPAIVNTPITTGDAIWTEPKAHSEISIAGTRVRLDGATQLDMLALDDTQTRMQLDQGRVDIKTFSYDASQPYELVTPRGVVALQQQGDYYVEAGSTQDPTRLGVRQGAAQFQTPNGQVLAVRAGQVAEVSGDGNAIQLHTIQAPPPPMPTYWAQRDKVVVYEQPPQYLSASVTGYEDLNYYGSWSNDPEYGQVWYARSVPQGWAPYTTGRWTSDPTYGWTWVDEQPWGFAPYHYGRWAQRNNRWFWVPPDRRQRAVYAPALVAFVGGTELGVALGVQNRQPVGWFPLGPREAYVPSYTSNRDYYRRLNLTARVQERSLEDRWQRAQRREAIQQTMLNRRFTTVVPSEDFARSRPVNRTAIRVAPERIASVPVAAVAAPPPPNQSMRAQQAPGSDRDGRGRDDRNDRADRPNDRDGRPGMAGAAAGAAGVAGAAALMAIKPEPERQRAPGPQIAPRQVATTAPAADRKPALPQLAPRNASAPPPPQIQGDRRPADARPGQQATAPADRPNTPQQPGVATPPGQPQADRPGDRDRNDRDRTQPAQPPQANAPTNRDRDDRDRNDRDRAQPGQPTLPGQANLPPVRDRNNTQRPEPPRPGEPPKPPQAQSAPAGQPAAPQPPRQPEPPRPPQAQTPPAGQQATPQPQRPGEPPKPPQAQSAPAGQPAAPQPQRQAEPPKPPQAHTPPRPPQQAAPQPRQAEPPKPQQATPPAPPPQQQIQRRPMPQHQPAAPPQRQAAPPPQTHPPAPAPRQVQAPRPQPAPPQAQAPRPQPAPPPRAQAPRPQPAPPQQAQAPRPQPSPPPQQAQPKPPQPQQQGQHKQDDKK